MTGFPHSPHLWKNSNPTVFSSSMESLENPQTFCRNINFKLNENKYEIKIKMKVKWNRMGRNRMEWGGQE